MSGWESYLGSLPVNGILDVSSLYHVLIFFLPSVVMLSQYRTSLKWTNVSLWFSCYDSEWRVLLKGYCARISTLKILYLERPDWIMFIDILGSGSW